MDISKELSIKLVQVLNFPSPYPFQLLIGGHHPQHENQYLFIYLFFDYKILIILIRWITLSYHKKMKNEFPQEENHGIIFERKIANMFGIY